MIPWHRLQALDSLDQCIFNFKSLFGYTTLSEQTTHFVAGSFGYVESVIYGQAFSEKSILKLATQSQYRDVCKRRGLSPPVDSDHSNFQLSQ